MSQHKTGDYSDIIDLPRPVSARRNKMTNQNRAAQFSPFAALTGYEEVLSETGRLTQPRAELTGEKISRLDGQLQWIRDHLDQMPEVCLIYFQPDSYKSGGAYLQTVGRVCKLDTYRQILVLQDGNAISFSQIYEIWGAGESGEPGGLY